MPLNDAERLKFIRNEQGRISQQKLADSLGIASHKIKDIEVGKTKISTELALLIEDKFHYDFKWILTGDEGHPYIKGGPPELGGQVHEPTQPYGHQYGDTPEVAELLAMTREIVKSDTNYALSLMANIRSFHQAMLAEVRYQALEDRIARIESRACSEKGQEIRTGDPSDQKEEIIKRRAM